MKGTQYPLSMTLLSLLILWPLKYAGRRTSRRSYGPVQGHNCQGPQSRDLPSFLPVPGGLTSPGERAADWRVPRTQGWLVEKCATVNCDGLRRRLLSVLPHGYQGAGVSLLTEAFSAQVEGCAVVLLRPAPATGSNLFKGSRVYGGSFNELEAYLYFSRASLEAVRVLGRTPDILHCHEWQISPVPMLFWEVYTASMPRTRVVLTIHNFDSTGDCREDEFWHTGTKSMKELYSTILISGCLSLLRRQPILFGAHRHAWQAVCIN